MPWAMHICCADKDLRRSIVLHKQKTPVTCRNLQPVFCRESPSKLHPGAARLPNIHWWMHKNEQRSKPRSKNLFLLSGVSIELHLLVDSESVDNDSWCIHVQYLLYIHYWIITDVICQAIGCQFAPAGRPHEAVPSSVRPALDAALGEASKALDAGDWQRALKRVWASKWTETRRIQIFHGTLCSFELWKAKWRDGRGKTIHVVTM